MEYWLNRAAATSVSFTATATGETVRVLAATGTVGLNHALWNGADANDLIALRGGYSIVVDANDGIGHHANAAPGAVDLTYPHDIFNVGVDPYCFVATNNEIVTVAYQTNVDANMVVEIDDPQGASWGLLLDEVAQNAGRARTDLARAHPAAQRSPEPVPFPKWHLYRSHPVCRHERERRVHGTRIQVDL